jgi:hypothetical protein
MGRRRLFSFSSLTRRAQVSVTAGSGVASLDPVRQMSLCVYMWAPRRMCKCGRLKGARGKVSTAGPRRERDVGGVDAHGEAVAQARLG